MAIDGVVELVEHTSGRIDHQRVPVAAGLRTTLDRGRSRERVWATVALIGVKEVNVNELRVSWGHLPWDPVGARAAARAIVGMQERRTRIHARQPCRRVAVHRQSCDRCVPDVVRRKRRAAGSRQELAGRGLAWQRLATSQRPAACVQHAERSRHADHQEDHTSQMGITRRHRAPIIAPSSCSCQPQSESSTSIPSAAAQIPAISIMSAHSIAAPRRLSMPCTSFKLLRRNSQCCMRAPRKSARVSWQL